jgi:hypothetical protein
MHEREIIMQLIISYYFLSCFSDLQFPIDLSCVERDHPFLMKDQLQSLYRRLLVLNRSAAMRCDGQYNRNVNVCCKIKDINLSFFVFHSCVRCVADARGAFFRWTDFMIDDSNLCSMSFYCCCACIS